MSFRRALLALLALALAFGIFGCTEPEPEPDVTEPASDAAAVPETAPADVDFSYLNGRWASETTLVDIDNEEFRFLGDQPGAQWECAVDGTTMQMQTADHLYTGELTAQWDNGWVYEGVADYTDEDGATWTSTILILAVQRDDDHFSGEFDGSIDSDTDGHLYTGTWEFTAERME